MAQQEWQVQRAEGVCASTGREIGEGEPFYSVLFEDGETFRRADFSEEGWQGSPDGAFCHYKTRMPSKEKRKQFFVDNEMLRAFFLRLAAETDPVRVQFRFVLALILMRKRLLRYDRSVVNDGVETWDVRLTGDGAVHRVVNPRLTENQIEEVSRQLGAVLHADMGDWTADEGSEAAPEEEPARSPDSGSESGPQGES